MVNLPNLITLIRLLMTPFIVWLIDKEFWDAAFWLVIFAGVSDGLDGWIAKNWGLCSRFGAFLDPIADKTLLVGVYIALYAAGVLESWLVILIVFRDLLIVGGAIFVHLVSNKLRMEPLLISKINTVLQIALAIVLLANQSVWTFSEMILIPLTLAVGATTAISGLAYVTHWWGILTQHEGVRG